MRALNGYVVRDFMVRSLPPSCPQNVCEIHRRDKQPRRSCEWDWVRHTISYRPPGLSGCCHLCERSISLRKQNWQHLRSFPKEHNVWSIEFVPPERCICSQGVSLSALFECSHHSRQCFHWNIVPQVQFIRLFNGLLQLQRWKKPPWRSYRDTECDDWLNEQTPRVTLTAERKPLLRRCRVTEGIF